MDELYELVLDGGSEKVVTSVHRVEVGDAVSIDDEIWVVLREAERAATTGRARFECARALRPADRSRGLIAYANALHVKVAEASEANRSVSKPG